jgi:hypothetical protein
MSIVDIFRSVLGRVRYLKNSFMSGGGFRVKPKTVFFKKEKC